MDENKKPTERRQVTDLLALIDQIIAYWKEIGRRIFEAMPDADPKVFEQEWPKTLENFFLAETIRVAKRLRFLSEGRDN